MPNEVAQLVAVADALQPSILAELRALPAEGWNEYSACQGWTIRHVVAHLGMVTELLGLGLNQALQNLPDDPPPPPVAAAGPEAYRAARECEIERRAGQSIPELLDLFERGASVLRRLSERVIWERPHGRGWHPRGPQTVAWLLGQWVMELAVHDWDMRVAFDTAAEVKPEALIVMPDELRERMPIAFYGEEAGNLAGLFRVELSGPTPAAWLVQVQDRRLITYDDAEYPVDATIRAETGAFALVLYNRVPVETCEEVGLWQVEGDTELTRAMAHALRGI